MKPHTISFLKHRVLLGFVLIFVGLWPSLLLAGPPNPRPVICDGPVCYECFEHQRLMLRLSKAISCKQKLAKRDAALASIKRTVNKWKEKDQKRHKQINDLTKERDRHRSEKEKAARELRKVWTIFWSVTGTVVLVSAVAIVAAILTRPPTASSTSPIMAPPFNHLNIHAIP